MSKEQFHLIVIVAIDSIFIIMPLFSSIILNVYARVLRIKHNSMCVRGWKSKNFQHIAVVSIDAVSNHVLIVAFSNHIICSRMNPIDFRLEPIRFLVVWATNVASTISLDSDSCDRFNIRHCAAIVFNDRWYRCAIDKSVCQRWTNARAQMCQIQYSVVCQTHCYVCVIWPAVILIIHVRRMIDETCVDRVL